MSETAPGQKPDGKPGAATGPSDLERDRGELLSLLSGKEALGEKGSAILSRLPPAELGSLLEDLPPSLRAKALSSVLPGRGAEAIRRLSLSAQTATLRRMPGKGAAEILGYIPSARSADLLQRMRPEEQRAILEHLVPKGGVDIQALLKYSPHTAGGMMSPTVLSVDEGMTVSEAAKRTAAFQDRRQTDLYITSKDGRLVGRCDLHDLLVADPSSKISAVMKEVVHAVEPDRDHQELRRLLAHDELRSIPVVGAHGALLGVVTEDHLLDAAEQEANEELAQVAGSKVSDPLHTPLWIRVRNRMPWLLLTLGGELFIALVIAKIFRPTIEKAAVLAAFIPAIMAAGGNVGLQATTMVIRGLGMGTLKKKHTARLIIGEMKLGVIMGLGCGLVAAVVAYLINWHYHEVVKISISVFLAMVSATLATSLVGTLEPLVLHRLKFDPATACGPFVTMFNDMFGSIVYLLIAMLMNFSPAPS